MAGYSPNNVVAICTEYISTPLTNFLTSLVTDQCGYDDDSLIVCDPIGSWRYYIQSFPVRRPL